jgi:hypothetical protein
MIYTETDEDGTTYRLNVDAALVREAESVVAQFSRPAQEQIARNMFGPREARFAAVIVQCAADVEKLGKLRDGFETEHGSLKYRLETQVEQLSRLLHEATEIIENHVVGFADRVEEFRDAAGLFEDCVDDPTNAGMQP